MLLVMVDGAVDDEGIVAADILTPYFSLLILIAFVGTFGYSRHS